MTTPITGPSVPSRRGTPTPTDQDFAQAALAAGVIRRYLDDRAPLNQIGHETRRTQRSIRDLLRDQQLRQKTGRPPARRPSAAGRTGGSRSRTRLRIGYVPAGRGPHHGTLEARETDRQPILDAIRAAGHDVFLLHPGGPAPGLPVDHAGRPILTAIIFELTRPVSGQTRDVFGSPATTGDPYHPQRLLDQCTIGHGVPTVLWDIDSLLLAEQLAVRDLPNVCVAGPAPRPDGALVLPFPIAGELLDHADAKQLSRRPRHHRLLDVGGRYDQDDDRFTALVTPALARMPHDIVGSWPNTTPWPRLTFTGPASRDERTTRYATNLATVLLAPAGQSTIGHRVTQLAHAVAHGCLPLIDAGASDAAQFLPEQLHVADPDQLTVRWTQLAGLAGTNAHQDLLTTCLLYLQRHRISRVVPMLLDALLALAQQHPARSRETSAC